MIKKYEAEVKLNEKETHDVHTIRFELDDPDFSFKAGQYMVIDLLDINENVIRSRAYSIASPPYKKNEIKFCVKRIEGGLMSNYLCDLSKGDIVRMKGPIGSMVLPDDITDDILLIGAGTGVAPYRSMIYKLLKEDRCNAQKIWLFFGERTQEDLFYKDEFEELEKKCTNFKFVPVLSRESWEGDEGHVQDAIPKYIKNAEGKTAFVCGLQHMVYDVSELLLNMGFPEDKIKREKY
ncbi:MAG: FAD-binding oxidoreductase [Candidatus Undinarchaeales archaeon]